MFSFLSQKRKNATDSHVYWIKISIFLYLLSVSLRAQVFTFSGVFAEEIQSAKSVLGSQCCLLHFSIKRMLDSGSVMWLYCLALEPHYVCVRTVIQKPFYLWGKERSEYH